MALAAISNALAAQSVEWVARTNGGVAKANAVPTAIATDKSGNIYVAGFVTAGIVDDGFNSGFLTVAYDRLGNERWARTKKVKRSHEASAVAVDADGRVYVAGSSYNGTDDDFFTVAYDSAGNELWTRLRNGTAKGDDHAVAVALDGMGRVYVAGSSYNDLDEDYLVVQYDSSGNELWARSKSGPAGKDTLAALAASAGGTVYLTGTSESLDHSSNFLTVAYDSAGNELWSRVESGEGYRASALVVDPGGNVYVAGSAKSERRESVYYNVAGSAKSESRESVDYVNYDSDYLTVKYDRDGNKLWSRQRNREADRHDSVSALAVDREGNVYVTGSSSDDFRTAGGCIGCERYLTVAYDSEGRELWARTKDDAEGLNYRAVAVGTDPDGAVVVTGNAAFRGDRRDIRASLNDYLTVKYDPGGRELWSMTKDGAESGWKSSDTAAALAIGADGHVFVAGAAVLSVGLDTGSNVADENPADFLTVSYDPLGAELWTKRTTTLAGSDDRPGHSEAAGGMAIEAHADGTVFVTGSSRKGREVVESDYLTAAYDRDGNELWVQRKDGPAGRNDEAYALALDASGRVAVTGATWRTESSSDRITASRGWSSRRSDYMTVLYDRAGVELWSRIKHDPADRMARATGVAFDGTGKVFVTGSSMTVAYDSGGNELWTRIKDPGDRFRAIDVDQRGNVYLLGSSYNGRNEDILTVAYDNAGNELWTRSFDGAAHGNDYAEALIVDANGQVLVTGWSQGMTDDFITVAYDSAGQELWARVKDSGRDDHARAMAVDGKGHLFVVGSIGDFYGRRFLTVAYDMAGTELWAQVKTRPSSLADEAYAVAADSSSHVYVTGSSLKLTTSTLDYLTVAYDVAGNELWSRSYDGGGHDSSYAVVPVGKTGAVVTGYSKGQGADYLTIRYETAIDTTPPSER